MVTKEMLFDDSSVNIFTDASIRYNGNEQIGCPGYIVTIGDNVVDIGCQIYRHSTSNRAEISAVKMGVDIAAKYQNFKYIRLFSDSQLCIFGLRERIYNWVKKIKNNQLCGYNGKPIINQDIFVEIAFMIVYNNIRVEFFHQRGHINILSPHDIQVAKNDFIRYNSINADISDDLIERISYYNNMVDNYTRDILNSTNIDIMLYQDACRFIYNKNFDITKYKDLTH